MDLLIAALKVVAGTFLLFLIANSYLNPSTAEKPFRWHLLVAFLAFGTMVFYRQIGHTVSVPAYTVLAFIAIIGGMDANFADEFADRARPILNRGRWFAAAGGFVGWLTFAQVGNV